MYIRIKSKRKFNATEKDKMDMVSIIEIIREQKIATLAGELWIVCLPEIRMEDGDPLYPKNGGYEDQSNGKIYYEVK